MIKRVCVRNYRSLADVEVDLDRFTIMVGPNGSGKSNFVDALSFLADCVTGGIDQAIRRRGGIDQVRRKGARRPYDFGISVELDRHIKVPVRKDRKHVMQEAGLSIAYSLDIKSESEAGFSIKQESCSIKGYPDAPDLSYSVKKGKFNLISPREMLPEEREIGKDQLGLSYAPMFHPVFRYVLRDLSGMRFYSLVPDHVRQIHGPLSGEQLYRDGLNAAAVLRQIEKNNPGDHKEICEILSRAVPGIQKVKYKAVEQFETIEFIQDFEGGKKLAFNTLSMSDGTLRILGILLAVYQVDVPSLLSIEEPEATVHPGSSAVLLDALREAQKRTQVLITTHSPDLLDHKDISAEQIRYVENDHGATVIHPIDPRSREMIRKRLYSAGELLREDKLKPDRSANSSSNCKTPNNPGEGKH